MKDKLLISFSGGQTSAYMLWYILQVNKIYQDYEKGFEIKVIFANTGKEHEETLIFAHSCAVEFKCEIIWIEAFPRTPKGWGVSARLVDFNTASRNGEPYEAMLAKLGIPSTKVPFCSDQLKRKAIEAYLKAIGWTGYYKAIGIRADEIDRVNPNHKKKKIVYPLVHYNISKSFINEWWNDMPFKLNVPANLGNCDGCWKKSDITLVQIARSHPNVFNWWEEMEIKYGYLNPRDSDLNPPFHFYRSNKSVKDIFNIAALEDTQLKLMPNLELSNGCSESCEVFK